MDIELLKNIIPSNIIQSFSSKFRLFFENDYTELSFKRFVGPDFEPEHRHLVEYIDIILSESFRSTEDILKDYYKSSKDESGSKSIFISDDVKKILKKTYGCPLKAKLLSNGKLKSAYLVKDNLNFVSLNYDDTKNSLNFNAVNYQEAKKRINKMKLFSLYYESSKLILNAKKSIGLDDPKNALFQIERVLGQAAYSRLMNMPRDQYEGYRNLYSYNVPFLYKNMPYQVDSKHKRIELIMKDGTPVAPTKSINLIFDYGSKITKELNDNSSAHSYQYINPVSGFVSIKNKRILKTGSVLSEKELESLAERVCECNKFFESISSEVKLFEMSMATKSKTEIKLVSGQEIVSYYNISSYLNNTYNYNNGDSISSMNSGGGTLFTSCMRMPNIKDKIRFYAENDHIVKLLVCVAADGKLLKGRAVVWYDESIKMHYVDRIFYSDEKTLLSIVDYINKTENMVTISPVNSYSSIHSAKKQSEFLIKFTGLKYTKDVPYFDSMYDSLFYMNDELYFGRMSADSLPKRKSEVIKDKAYRTSITFSSCLSPINLNSKIFSSANQCYRCGRNIADGEFIIVENKVVCKRHLYITNNNIPLLNYDNNFYSTEKSIDSFITNVIVGDRTKSDRVFRITDTRYLDCESNFNYRNALMPIGSLIPANAVKELNSSVFTVNTLKSVDASDAKKASDGGILFSQSRLNKYNLPVCPKTATRTGDYKLHYDTKTVKEITVPMTNKKVLIPLNMTDSQIIQMAKNIKFTIIAQSRENLITITNPDYIAKFNIKVGYLNNSCFEKCKRELSATKNTDWMSLNSVDKLYSFDVNGEIKNFIYNRTNSYSIYIPIDCIKSTDEKIDSIDAELIALLKKETANG